MKHALITGITGQDGSYLAELLLSKGYKVFGIMRRKSMVDYGNANHLKDQVTFIYADMTDLVSLTRAMKIAMPDEVYNLAAQSFVATSWEQPLATADIDAIGVTNILEAIRDVHPKARFYQASTSELFGKVVETPQSETTPFYPRSPYGVSKLYAYWTVINYREAYGIFACNGIMFNHESPIRGETFVSRKISLAVAKIAKIRQTGDADSKSRLYVGNIDAKRDWGHAADYVEGMWKALQCEQPDDYVFATGETHTVREFIELAFQEIGIEIQWTGTGTETKGVDAKTGQIWVEIDPQFFRPADVELLLGNANKAKEKLGWVPKRTFRDLVHEMVQADLIDGRR